MKNSIDLHYSNHPFLEHLLPDLSVRVTVSPDFPPTQNEFFPDFFPALPLKICGYLTIQTEYQKFLTQTKASVRILI